MAPFVCMLCGHRAAEDHSDCPGCGKGPLLDIRVDDARQLIEEDLRRRRERRMQSLLWLGVATAMLGVFALWMIPEYRDFRHKNLALPLMVDQLALMGGIAFLAQKALSRLFPVRSLFAEIA